MTSILNTLLTLPAERDVIAESAKRSVLRTEQKFKIGNFAVINAQPSTKFGVINGSEAFEAVAVITPENPLKLLTPDEIATYLDYVANPESLGEELDKVLPKSS